MSSSGDDRANRALRGLRAHEDERSSQPALPERYRIASEIGRGGMAVVYRAHDAQLDRDVAIKVLRDDLRVSDADAERFRREAAVTAKLQHPHVVTVHDAGEAHLVMELVEGRSLAEVLDERRLGHDETVVLIEKIARAVHAAHLQGVVHRDLKPSNVLVTHDGEPKVADFGVAHLLGDMTGLTQSGAVVGTPRYMAPEQVRQGQPISPRTDVYALGAILYEALTGEEPHTGETPVDLFKSIVEGEPIPPRRHDPLVADDLQTIVLKALAKEPARRYASAEELAEDLTRFRSGEPIRARRASVAYRLRKQVLRRRGVTLAIAGGVIAVVLALAILLPRLGRSERTFALWRDLTRITRQAELDARAGDLARADGRLDEGIAKCRAFLENDDVADAHYFLGRLLRARGDRDGALAELNRALDKSSELAEAHLERGLLYVELYEQREMSARSMLAGQPAGTRLATKPEDLERADPELRELRTRAIRDLRVPVERREYVRDVESRYGTAELDRLRWRWDEASKALHEIVGREPLFAHANLALAKLGRDRQQWNDAIEHANAAIEAHEGLGEAYLIRGQAYFENAESARATVAGRVARENSLSDLNKAAELLRNESRVLTIRGGVRWRLGDPDGALADFDAALATDNPYRAIAWNHRGVIHFERGDNARARADFTAAIESSPTYAVALVNRAQLLAASGEVAPALEDARAAMKAAPPEAPYRQRITSLIEVLEQMR